ncbi:uncharacterized protein At2g33490-like isoform X2 [Mangifera indica]|uniref:uncharacterized protein At2g33490-like isoform X2 n=1 Tax=Mangifera indica TaxID=29780 RepID=UPI001CFB1F0F|nr:uncharacterized protein At2g33490-like isoform X2 [Mangifera indica]
MMSSLYKLRRFALHKTDNKDKFDFSPSAQVDELFQAAQEMQDMRNFYDSLLSAAAATANSAYEFSESLHEMGSCLLEKAPLQDDEEGSRILLMLGKVQFELQKLVDSYRSHIILTITNPSESLLNELRMVEDMKRQCDEKRSVYEYMMARQREKGRSKNGKGESFTPQQLQTASDEYDEEATLCIFRLKSLREGQYRSLLTQAARHHAAQLHFFRKGLKSLEAVDTHVRSVAERQHIDYQFSGLEDDEGEDVEDSYYSNEAGELSFDYRQNKQGLNVVSTSRNLMEMDEVGISFPQTLLVENAETNLDKNPGNHPASNREPRESYSAPLFPEKKNDQSEKFIQIQPARKSSAYVLPTPTNAKVPILSKPSTSIPFARPTNPTGRTHNPSHSSPLERKKQDKDHSDGNMSDLSVFKSQSVLKESNSNTISAKLPPPLAEGFSIPQMGKSSDTKNSKRYAFSGPMTSKTSSTKLTSIEPYQLVSAVLNSSPVAQSSVSPRRSPSASPPPVSSPRLSELHELPRPPSGLASNPGKSQGLVGHSAPLMSRNQEHTATNKSPSVVSSAASPLPIPPLIIPRSFSIPSSSEKAMTLHVSKPFESPKVGERAEDVSSPPLTPISLGNIKPV